MFNETFETFFAICLGNLKEVKRIVADNPEYVHIKNEWGWTVLDRTIADGKLKIAQYLWEKGGRPNLERLYCNKMSNPVNNAAYGGHTATLEWVFAKKVFALDVLKIKTWREWTPLDTAIAYGNLATAKYLWGMGGKPNLDYRNNTPVYWTAYYGHTETLKWVFTTENVLPLWVLQIKNEEEKKTPLDVAISKKDWKTTTFLRHLFSNVDSVFLAMQRAKRNTHQCVLRRLPDELLDMVVDEVAARFRLKVEW